ncbi:hypothetical protein HANVADRAFT_8304 [Hanseniaspora valbyensis NRRL Y-1626]|uniref:Uncharacterized protein n=1 Tax=Hanseniaspora valbyensis NRRL Y-1626 TaxID=766949 RepID=A0A1B7T8H3_9ASCO|nr:hypothetical protein HANVADRAFT_8304 [Hanseniaspora valbyensis NRRL Y-1626]
MISPSTSVLDKNSVNSLCTYTIFVVTDVTIYYPYISKYNGVYVTITSSTVSVTTDSLVTSTEAKICPPASSTINIYTSTTTTTSSHDTTTIQQTLNRGIFINKRNNVKRTTTTSADLVQGKDNHDRDTTSFTSCFISSITTSSTKSKPAHDTSSTTTSSVPSYEISSHNTTTTETTSENSTTKTTSTPAFNSITTKFFFISYYNNTYTSVSTSSCPSVPASTTLTTTSDEYIIVSTVTCPSTPASLSLITITSTFTSVCSSQVSESTITPPQEVSSEILKTRYLSETLSSISTTAVSSNEYTSTSKTT